MQMDAELKKRLSLDHWRSADEAARRNIITDLEASGELRFLRWVGAEQVPAMIHAPTQILFHLVPGGTWRLGFSDTEADALFTQYRGWGEADMVDDALSRRESLPKPFTAAVDPFLLAARPLDEAQLERLRNSDRNPPETADVDGVAAMTEAAYLETLGYEPEEGLREIDLPAVETGLGSFGLRLPTDDEWEAAARAGGRTAFSTGDTIPDDPYLGPNPFGFIEMGAWCEVVWGEWTDAPQPNPAAAHAEALILGTDPPTPGERRRARGGAGLCYPWQDCAEWVLLLCAGRVPAKAFDEMLSVRPVLPL